jgi:hypothetical protein
MEIIVVSCFVEDSCETNSSNVSSLSCLLAFVLKREIKQSIGNMWTFTLKIIGKLLHSKNLGGILGSGDAIFLQMKL